jgi:hypothetical protein
MTRFKLSGFDLLLALNEFINIIIRLGNLQTSAKSPQNLRALKSLK